MSGDRERRRWWQAAAVALLAATVALTAIDRPTPTGSPTPTRTEVAPLAAQPHPPASASGSVGSRELRRVARRFLDGYLARVYGNGPARRSAGAARRLHRLALRAERRSDRPGRERRGRVVGLRVVGGFVAEARGWRVRARVADGRNVAYPVELLIAERDGRLVVIATGDAG